VLENSSDTSVRGVEDRDDPRSAPISAPGFCACLMQVHTISNADGGFVFLLRPSRTYFSRNYLLLNIVYLIVTSSSTLGLIV
jgi:hypothetical protein